MADKKKKEEKPSLPTTEFQVGNVKYKFNQPVFIVPGFNKNQPITAKEALKDAKVLALLAKIDAGVIDTVGETEPAKEGGK